VGKIIGLVSGKGGVGKTTTALMLGALLSNFGKDVLVVDANISSPDIANYLKIGNKKTLQRVVKEKINVVEAIFPHDSGMKLILGDSDIELLAEINVFEVEDALKSLYNVAEIIILDGPPGINEESLVVMRASDSIIVVTNNDVISIKQAKRIIEVCRKIQTEVLGAIIVENIPHKKVDKEEVERYLDTIVLGIIPYNKKINIKKEKYFKEKRFVKDKKIYKAHRDILNKIGLIEIEKRNKLFKLFFG